MWNLHPQTGSKFTAPSRRTPPSRDPVQLRALWVMTIARHTPRTRLGSAPLVSPPPGSKTTRAWRRAPLLLLLVSTAQCTARPQRTCATRGKGQQLRSQLRNFGPHSTISWKRAARGLRSSIRLWLQQTASTAASLTLPKTSPSSLGTSSRCGRHPSGSFTDRGSVGMLTGSGSSTSRASCARQTTTATSSSSAAACRRRQVPLLAACGRCPRRSWQRLTPHAA